VALSLDPLALNFPDRCVECGAPPTRTFRLTGRRRDHLALNVPICERCGERKGLGQVLWVLASIGIAIGFVLGLATAGDAMVRSEPGLRAFVGPIVLVVMLCGGLIVWLANRAGRRSFHRRFSAVWIGGFAGNRVALGVRRAELEADIATLSGAAIGAASTDQPAYRGFALAAPKAHDGIARRKPASALVVLVGLGVIAGGIADYCGKVHTRSWAVMLFEHAFGRVGVLVVFIAIGVAFVAAGVAMWRRSQQR
jgi:hypothetical protein